jgi:hypothetical protein
MERVRKITKKGGRQFMNNNYTYPQQQYTVPVYRQQQQPNFWVNTNPIPQVRPVSSVEEVRACPIEFDGSVFYFPDIANKKIYTKFINMDGTVAINLYELKDLTTITEQPIDTSMFVTRPEFENAMSELKKVFEESNIAP